MSEPEQPFRIMMIEDIEGEFQTIKTLTDIVLKGRRTIEWTYFSSYEAFRAHFDSDPAKISLYCAAVVDYDLGFNKENGISVIQQIKEWDSGVYCILHTGFPGTSVDGHKQRFGILRELNAAGCDFWIEKNAPDKEFLTVSRLDYACRKFLFPVTSYYDTVWDTTLKAKLANDSPSRDL